MYDWANSAFQTTIIAGIFPIFFKQVAAAGLPEAVANSRFYWTTTASILVMALIAPVLGAMADARPLKKRLLGLFLAVGVAATCAMGSIDEGEWRLALGLFAVGNIAVAGSIVFYESLLPFVAGPAELDRVSTAGYALGYIGGGVLLAFNIVMIQQPAWFGLADAATATRMALVSVGVWWAVFALPLFRQVPEPRVTVASASMETAVDDAFRKLGQTLRELRRYRQAMLMLGAFFLYNDGVQTIIRVAVLYGEEIGIDTGSLITALLLVQFVGVPCSFLFGGLAGRIGPRRGIFLGLSVYLLITVLAYFMSNATHFYALAIGVGLVQGGTQALSRSLFASMVPKSKSSEFFAFFGVFERYAGVLGPAIFAVVSGGGSSRVAILSLSAFFVLGMVALSRVDVAEGQRAAQEAA
jgi:UMF1 family MFS transporter